MKDIMGVAKTIGLNERWAKSEAEKIQEIVFDELRKYLCINKEE